MFTRHSCILPYNRYDVFSFNINVTLQCVFSFVSITLSHSITRTYYVVIMNDSFPCIFTLSVFYWLSIITYTIYSTKTTTTKVNGLKNVLTDLLHIEMID